MRNLTDDLHIAHQTKDHLGGRSNRGVILYTITIHFGMLFSWSNTHGLIHQFSISSFPKYTNALLNALEVKSLQMILLLKVTVDCDLSDHFFVL